MSLTSPLSPAHSFVPGPPVIHVCVCVCACVCVCVRVRECRTAVHGSFYTLALNPHLPANADPPSNRQGDMSREGWSASCRQLRKITLSPGSSFLTCARRFRWRGLSLGREMQTVSATSFLGRWNRPPRQTVATRCCLSAVTWQIRSVVCGICCPHASLCVNVSLVDTLHKHHTHTR